MVVSQQRKTTASSYKTTNNNNILDPTGKVSTAIKSSVNTSGSQMGESDNAEPNSAVERGIGITTFVDAEDTQIDMAPFTGMSHSTLIAPDDEPMHLEQVMNRPVFLNNITWNTSQATGTLLAAYSVPDAILNNSTIKQAKIAFNQFLTADVVFRIEAAPIQLQAGRLWMCFEPYRQQRAARAIYGFPSQFTALPGVEYDPAKPCPVELRIPFTSLLSAWDLPMGQMNTGTLLIYVLSPLNSAAATSTVTLSTQAWFENVRARVPCQAPYASAPQASVASLRSLSLSDPPRPFPELPDDFISGTPMRFEANEQGAAQKHWFSTALTRIGNVAGALSHFPLLSAVASPVSHFAHVSAKVAAYFGFSKPADVSAPTKITSHNRSAWTNADGPLPLVKLAHSTENAVDQTGNHFPNPYDEMEISYITSNLSMVGAWQWTTASPVGSLITVLPIHPGVVPPQVSSGTYTFGTYAPTPLAYVASMFKYWAGSIKFKMEAVSTPFHAGRLVLAYMPDYNPFINYSIQDVGNNYSVVWDITDSSQIDFEVPYLGNSPYLDVFLDDQLFTTLLNGETSGFQARDRIRKVSNGAIMVFVLNQLVAPSAAANTISILNWIAGGEDITFAEPVMGVYKAVEPSATRIEFGGKWYDGSTMTAAPYPVAPNRAALVAIDEEIPEALNRAAFETFDEVDLPCPLCEKDDETILGELFADMVLQSNPSGLAPTGPDNLYGSRQQQANFQNFIPMHRIDPRSRARLAMGEPVTNLRTLTRRLTPAYELYPQDVTTAGQWDASVTPPTNLNVLCIDPDYFGTGDGQDDSTIYTKQIGKLGNANWITELESALSYVGRMYCFARGSRLYGLSSRPSDVVNASRFQTLPDELYLPADRATFDMRLSTIVEEDTAPRQPYFRPEDNLIGYNYENISSSTLSGSNYTYGFNSALSGNFAVQKSGEAGCALLVQVPPTSKYPFKVLSTTTNSDSSYITSHQYTAPRSRRFLEVRYRPFTSTLGGSGAAPGYTATYSPHVWPLPTTIMEAGADDFSFGGIMPPPLITKVSKTIIFPNYSTGARLAL